MTDTQQQQQQPETPPQDRTPAGVLGFSKRTKVIVAVAAVLIAILVPAFLAFQSTVQFNSVANAVQANPTPTGQTLGVQGKLVPNSYVQSADGLSATFQLRDEDQDSPHLTVLYDGEIGQLFFNEYSEIILEGTKQPSGDFVAERLTVKCPSKYQTEEEALQSETT